MTVGKMPWGSFGMMNLPEVLGFVEEVLVAPSSSGLPEGFLPWLLKESGAARGILIHRGIPVVGDERLITDGEGTSARNEFRFDVDGENWILILDRSAGFSEDLQGVLALVLRAVRLRSELRRARFDTRFHLWELEVIRHIGDNITHLEDPALYSRELLSHLVSLLGLRSAQIYLHSNDEPAGSFGNRHLGPSEVEAAREKPLHRKNLIALPLQGNQETLGVLVAAEKEARTGIEDFSEEDRRLLELFAVQISVAFEYAAFARKSLERDRMQRELKVAATIQRHLLPEAPPKLPAFEIVARSTPSLHVAGDTYDIISGNGGNLVIAITDVSGKGVGAGLIASGIHAGVRLMLSDELRLEDLCARLNHYLCKTTADNRFATFAMIRLDESGWMEAVNAGHCPILIRRADGTVERISSSGLPLGIMETGTYRSEERNLEKGSLVLLYTDGFTEAEDDDEEEFGVEGVVETISAAPGGVAGATEALFQRVREYTDGRPLADDATLVAVEYRAVGRVREPGRHP